MKVLCGLASALARTREGRAWKQGERGDRNKDSKCALEGKEPKPRRHQEAFFVALQFQRVRASLGEGTPCPNRARGPPADLSPSEPCAALLHRRQS